MGYRDKTPPAPKPYDFVPISPLEYSDRQMPQGHEAYSDNHISGQLKTTLVVATPLHVGDGRARYRPGHRKYPLVRSFTRIDNTPCIPATTLKGTLRSVVESITRSCVRITRARASDLPSGAAPCNRKDNLCLACRMFGALGFEGHIRFADARLISDTKMVKVDRMPALYAPRNRAGRYYNRSQVQGRKFYHHGRTTTNGNTPVETLPPESQLNFTVRFDNLTAAELGVLLTALGLGNPPFALKLGGGKPACYGSFVVLPPNLEVDAKPAILYAAYDAEPPSTTDLEKYLQMATPLLEQLQLEQLAKIWKYDMRRRCPEGNY